MANWEGIHKALTQPGEWMRLIENGGYQQYYVTFIPGPFFLFKKFQQYVDTVFDEIKT
jgi:hypothetical protein